MKRLDAYWYSQNPVAWLLWPVSLFYHLLVSIRCWLYKVNLKKSYKISVPLVVVGNIAVGGTGKTPLLIALCELLIKHGIKPGVVSRGYGADFTGEDIVDDKDTPSTVGDEPYLIWKRTRCPVSVGKDRVAAAELLLRHHSCDVVLSDDGLQHYRMRRDLEIAVVDTNRRFGNGYMLPAGPLREPVRRLYNVDFIVENGRSSSKDSFELEFSDAINLLSGDARPVEAFQQATVHAVAGIGHPERFFQQLEQTNLTVSKHPFPDHHIFNESDLEFNQRSDGQGEATVLMTEKDAVKCASFAADHLWYVPVSANLSDHFVNNFLSQVKPLINA